jgi:hypothetical protein
MLWYLPNFWPGGEVIHQNGLKIKTNKGEFSCLAVGSFLNQWVLCGSRICPSFSKSEPRPNPRRPARPLPCRQGNHIHLLVKANNREGLQNFFRVVAGHSAQRILKEFPLSQNVGGTSGHGEQKVGPVDEFDRGPLLSVCRTSGSLEIQLNHFQPTPGVRFLGTNTVKSVLLEEF